MPTYLDQLRQRLANVDSQIDFSNAKAKSADDQALIFAKAQAAAQENRRKLAAKAAKSQTDQYRAAIDQHEADQQAAQSAQGQAAPPPQTNAGLIPVPTDVGAVNPQAGGGPQPIDVGASGGPQPAATMANAGPQPIPSPAPLNPQTLFGKGYSIDPNGIVTQTSTVPLHTGIRGIDLINTIATIAGHPLLTQTSTGPDFNATMALRREARAEAKDVEERQARDEAKAARDQQVKLQQQRFELAQDRLEVSRKSFELANKRFAEDLRQHGVENAQRNYAMTAQTRNDFVKESEGWDAARDSYGEIQNLFKQNTRNSNASMVVQAARLAMGNQRVPLQVIQQDAMKGSLPQNFQAAYDLAVSGTMPEALRENVRASAEGIFTARLQTQLANVQKYQNIAKTQGLDPKLVTPPETSDKDATPGTFYLYTKDDKRYYMTPEGVQQVLEK